MSNMNPIIHIQNLSKAFAGIRARRVVRILRKHLFTNGSAPKQFLALREINLTISRGDKIALVGNNGSGKTTLLKLIAGLYRPSEGRIDVNGRVLLLRGVGTGMVDELSVAENIFLYGIIYGMERSSIKEKLEEIIEWAELKDFVAAELRTLSSGMKARLAFSVTRHFDTDVFLLDEAFAVGDKDFRAKYEEVFRNHRNGDRTYLIATHDLDFARLFCRQTIWLQKGRLMAFGETEGVLDQYLSTGSQIRPVKMSGNLADEWSSLRGASPTIRHR
jgi:ABC-type polysaccharide/polyol phosphate transport system ATPase subunit